MGARRTLTAFVVCSLVAGAARAEDTGSVSIGGACMPPETSAPEVLRILQAELAPRQVRLVDAPDAPSAEDDVVLAIDACTDSPPGARVTIWQHGERRVLPIVLGDAAEGTSSRTFALALAETVRKVTAEPHSEIVLVPVAATKAAPPAPPPVVAAAPPRLTVRGSGEFRFVGKASTPLVGADVGIAGSRLVVGLTVLGTERTTSLGTASLLAVAAFAAADLVDLTPVLRLRASAELGMAVANGAPVARATGHTVAGSHVALDAGLAALVPFDSGWKFDGYVGGGYAPSLAGDSNGKDAVALSGWFVTCTLGARLPAFL